LARLDQVLCLRIHPFLLESAVDRPGGDAEELRTEAFVPPDVRQGGVDDPPFDLLERRSHHEGERSPVSRDAPAAAHLGRQIVDLDRGSARKHHGALDGVLELAHVARPLVAAQRLRGGARKSRQVAVVARGISLKEVLGQERDIVAAIAQRRDRHRDDVEAIVEILAEAPLPHGGAQVLIGGGHQAQVHLQGPPAEPLDLPLLQHAQQLHLDVRRDLPDLVEKQRAPVGLDEPPVVALGRASEGPLFVPEQLRLEDRLRQRGAVDRHERAAGARRAVVDGTRQQLLAGPRFAEQQHRRLRRRRLHDDLHRPAPGQRLSDERAALLGRQLGAQRTVLLHQ